MRIDERCYTYEFCDPSPFPVRDYRATLRITPITDRDGAFVEWTATFDCELEERDTWIEHFALRGFATWLESLRARLRT